MSKRTVIKADEELVIKGKLTVEGNVTQIETTQVVNRLESNSLVINSDGENVTAELTLNSDGTEATISFDNGDGEFNFNKPINLGDHPIATTGNISGANINGTYFIGDGSNITGLTTSIVSEGANLYYTVTRANNAIDARVTTAFVNALAVDYDSLSNTPINVSEFVNDAGYLVAANLVSLTANVDSVNGQTGVVTLDTDTIPEASNLYYTDARANTAMDAYLVGGDGIDYTSGTIDVDGTVIRTTGDQTITGNTAFVGTTSVTGDIVPTAANTMNLGSWENHFGYVFANVLHAEYLDLEDANISDIHNTFYVDTNGALSYTHNANGAYYSVVAGDGITLAGNNVAVDNTVVRTTGDQTITGNIGINGTLTVAGTINSQNVEDTYVKDTKITLNSNAAVDNTVSIEVNRPVAGANTYIKWDESTDQWKFTNNGSTEFLLPTSTTDLAEGANLYYTAARANTAMDTYLVGGAGLTYSSGTFAVGAGTGITVNADDVQLNADYVKNLISGSNGVSYNSSTGALTVDSTVIRTTGDQSLANVKSFTGELVIPASVASANGAIYYDSNTSQAFIIINGNPVELTPASLVGDVEDVGSTGIDIYAGYRELPGASATVTQSFQGALGTHTSNITVLSLGNTNNRFTPTVSTYDTEGFFTGNTIVIPANSTLEYAEIYGSVSLVGSPDNSDIGIQIWKNGNIIVATERLVSGEKQVTTSTDGSIQGYFLPGNVQVEGNVPVTVQLSTGVIPVTANDTFELKVFTTKVDAYESNPGTYPIYQTLLLGNKSYFGIHGVLATPSVEASKVHGIKSIDVGSHLDISEASNVITITGNTSSIRGLISASGNISYDSANGIISENLTTTDIDEGNNLYFTAARARGNISGSGLITYNSNTGVISTTADNYSNWNVQTDSGVGALHNVTSNSTVIVSGGTGITVTNTGGNITIASTNSADIEAVTAGSGLTGGGTSGAVTLNVGAGAGITVNADNVALSTSGVVAGTYGSASSAPQLIVDSYGRTTSATNVAISISASQVSDFTSAANTAIDARVSGGAGLTYSSGVLAVGAGDGITVNADNVAVDFSTVIRTNSSYVPGSNQTISLAGSFGSGTPLEFIFDLGQYQERYVTITGSGTSNRQALRVDNTSNSSEGAEFILTKSRLGSDASNGDDLGIIGFYQNMNPVGYIKSTKVSGGTSDISIKTGANNLSNAIVFHPDSSVTISDAYTLPTTDGTSGQKLTTYGNGTVYWSTESADITEVVAGSGLTGGGSSGPVTLNIGAGTGITVNADNVAVNMGAFSTSDLAEGSNLYFTTARANSAIDARISGGSGLTYSSGTLAVGAGSYILVGADDVAVDATSNNTANKVVARDASGNFAANVITATATTARYADLAENYLGDADYLPGTVLVFGGEAEVTACLSYESTRVAGVVTTQPAHVMNSDLTGNHVTCIALRGRVPVKVKGVVRKGDVLVTAGEGHVGYAVASLDPRGVPAAAVVGKAIADKLDAGLGVVEALI
jgi:hypothetical protein